MKIIAKTGNQDLAMIYLAKTDNGQIIEFVESIQPPLPREKKWVLIISTLFGCPVKCLMCDAGGNYHGKLSTSEILFQIDYLIRQRFPDIPIPCEKFKIQFARMGEPALNPNVLEVLKELPIRYNTKALMPSISSVAPANCENFFAKLLTIKQNHYINGQLQLQFSLHSTDEEQRQKIIPIKKWSLAQIASYGENFYQTGDRKITLNFALTQETMLNARVLKQHFAPNKFLIKITPLNPTLRSQQNNLQSLIGEGTEHRCVNIIKQLETEGYEVLLSIGEYEENKIGSNCGQYVKNYLHRKTQITNAYQAVSLLKQK